MSSAMIMKWRNLLLEGRFLDVINELEANKVRLTVAGEEILIDGPPQFMTTEMGGLLYGAKSQLQATLRIASLATDRFGSSRLHHCVLAEDLKDVDRHLKNGARPNSENRFGITPFHAALQLNNKEIIERLALGGADLGKPDIDGRTPLHIAIEARDQALVNFLLANGAPVSKGDFFGQTPLCRAIGSDQGEIAQLLVEYDADFDDPDLSILERNFLQLVLRMLRGYSDELYAHSLRVADVARCLARDLELTEDEIKTARLGGLLHDLGKVSLPDDIFDQADADVNEENVELLMSHPEDGAAALNRHLTPPRWAVHPIILHHHEKWDGTGFPNGLAGEQIPITAQLVGLADYYDHLVTHRSYDPAIPQEQALAHLNELSEEHFSDEVLETLYRVRELLPFYTPAR